MGPVAALTGEQIMLTIPQLLLEIIRVGGGLVNVQNPCSRQVLSTAPDFRASKNGLPGVTAENHFEKSGPGEWGCKIE